MGLSLRNITKKIENVAGSAVGSAYHGVNPFDAGQGWTTAKPAAQQLPAATQQAFLHPKFGNTVGNPAAQQAMVQHFQPIHAFNPITAAIPALGEATQKVVVNPVAHGLAEIPTSITGKTYHPNNVIARNIFGPEPVAPIQQDVKNVYRGAKQGAHPGFAAPAAAADAIFHVATDVPLAGSLAKGVDVAARPVVKAAVTASKDLRPLDEVGGIVKPKLSLKGGKQKVAVKQSLPEVKTTLPAPKADTYLNRLKPITDRLNSLGGSNSKIAQGLIDKRNISEKGFAQAKFDSPTISRLKKPQQAAAIDALETGVPHANPEVNQAAKEMKAQFDKIYGRVKATGKDLPYRKNYFPHFVDIPKQGSGDYNSAIDHLIKTKQAKDPAGASKLLEFTRQSRGQTKFGSFENKRVADLPDYAKTAGAYHHYLEEAYKQIGHYKTFGVDDQKLNAMINKVSKEGGDVQKARALFNEADNRKVYNPVTDKLANALTTFQGGTKLGTSAIGNLAQQGNNIIAGGVGRTVKAGVKAGLSRSNKDFIRKTGVTSEQVSREAIQSRGTTGVIRKVTSPLFEPVEKGNRAVGAIVGRDQANTIAGRLAKAVQKGDSKSVAKFEGQLRDRFGIQGKIGPKLTENQQIDAARKFVERTQFRTGAQDLPSGAASPLGRVVTQFKRYPYKQTQFIGREVVKPLRGGNPLPLVRTAGVAVPTGAGVNAVRNAISGRDTSQDSLTTALLDASQSGGGTGLETNLARSLNPLGSKDANSYVTKATSTLGGPTAGDIINGTKAGYAAAANKPGGDPSRFTPGERLALQHVPVVGRPIANRALPYASQTKPTAQAGADTMTPAQHVKAGFTSKDPSFVFNGKDMSPADFIKLSDSDKKVAASGDMNARNLYDTWKAAKSAFEAPKLYAPGLDNQSTSTLKMFDRLTTQGRDKVYARQSDAEYRYALAKYQNDKLNGDLTEAEDIRRQDDLAKKYIGSTVDKNTRDIYGLAKKDIAQYVSQNPNAAAALQGYDQALLSAGLITSAKFKNGFGASSGGSSSSKTAAANPYKYKISTKYSSAKRPRVSVRSGRSKGGSKVASSGKYKVSTKKSLV